METKKSFWESFKSWFGIGALLFGTYCGANMASGAYAGEKAASRGDAASMLCRLLERVG